MERREFIGVLTGGILATPGRAYYPFFGDHDAILEEIEEFLTGTRSRSHVDHILATVLFTDVVDATRKAVELGDRRWRELLDAHPALIHEELTRFRRREIDAANDGFLAGGPTTAC